MSKTESKGELVTLEQKPGVLTKPTCEIKLNTKISKADLINTAVFDLEEKLVFKKKDLQKDIMEHETKLSVLEEEINSMTDDIKSTYKDDKLIKLLQEFSDEKIILKSEFSRFEKNKMMINIKICKRNRYYDRFEDLDLVKTITQDIPKNLSSKKTEEEKYTKNLESLRSEFSETELKIKELPMIKKKIDAALIKSLMSNNVKNTEDVINQLKTIIAKQM